MKKAGKSRLFFFDVVFGILFIMLLIWGSIDYSKVPMLTPIVAFLLGSAFSCSKMLRDDLYIARGFYWVSQHVIMPRTTYNHFVVGFILILMGFLSALTPSRDIAADEILWKSLVRSPSFWILCLAVIVFNGMVGVYRYRSYKRRKEVRVEENGERGSDKPNY